MKSCHFSYSSQLRKARIEFIRRSGWKPRVVALFEEAECHSDDEYSHTDAFGRDVYHINRKEGRNPLVTEFIRWVDKARLSGPDLSVWKKVNNKTQSRLTGPRRAGQYQERLRIYPENPSPSIFTTQPSNVPIDYFAADYWNELPVNIRTEFKLRIAFPNFEPHQNANWPNVRHDSKTMPDAEFMENYGRTVLLSYDLPTDEEVKQMEEYDALIQEEMADRQEELQAKKEREDRRNKRREKKMNSFSNGSQSKKTGRSANA